MRVKCNKCGEWTDYDVAYPIVRRDRSKDYVCETCLNNMLDGAEITLCAACGERVYADSIDHLDVYDQRDTFDKCPCCGDDVLTGLTFEEAKEEAKFSDSIMTRLRQRRGLDPKDTSMDDELMNMSPEEMFEELLVWEGIFGYSQCILDWMNELFR